MGELLRTPLADWHAAHGGRLVEFGGWWMPVQYSSIVAEHQATRQSVGLFDISHMGRLRFDGAAAAVALDGLLTRRVLDLPVGKVRYGLVLNDSGGVVDDVLVARLVDGAGSPYYLLVVNASNRLAVLQTIAPRLTAVADVSCTDLTAPWAMLAVQGPRALELVQPLLEVEVGRLKNYSAVETRIAGHGGIVSRTGYTGEDGVELIVGSAVAVDVWNTLVARAAPLGGLPCGLGARDTLRLEAGMPLYGHELTATVDPFAAGLDFAVDLAPERDFLGAQALRGRRDAGPDRVRVGLRLDGKRVPREGFPILAAAAPGAEVVGVVTSGTFSPTFERPLAMGYVAPQYAAAGTRVAIEIRGRAEPAEVAKLPFYRRPPRTASSAGGAAPTAPPGA